MTNDEFRNLPLYSTVKIDYGSTWQFVGVLVCKWMPADLKQWQGHVYIEKHDGQDYHSIMWANILNLSVVNVATMSGGLSVEQKSKLTNAISLIQGAIA
jgi:hypothetical protein